MRARRWLLSLCVVSILGGVCLEGRADPVYICVGVCTPVIVTDPTLPPTPTLGKLVNVLNVPIEGVLYDVAFVDGTFNDIFGTTAPSLHFTTGDQAQKAAEALASTLVDVGDQYFDTNPWLTRGCSWDQACLIMTPFSLELGDFAFRWVGFTNDNPLLGIVPDDSVGDASGILDSRTQDFNTGDSFDDRTFAVWRLAAETSPPGDDPLNRFFTPPSYGATAAIDEPNAIGLIILAIALLVVSRYGRAFNSRPAH
jgi:hypothetical protein